MSDFWVSKMRMNARLKHVRVPVWSDKCFEFDLECRYLTQMTIASILEYLLALMAASFNVVVCMTLRRCTEVVVPSLLITSTNRLKFKD